jgi:hypothetical protein
VGVGIEQGKAAVGNGAAAEMLLDLQKCMERDLVGTALRPSDGIETLVQVAEHPETAPAGVFVFVEVVPETGEG